MKTSLPTNPAVRIIFDGLLVLRIDREKQEARVGVYEYANCHDLSVVVTRKRHSGSQIGKPPLRLTNNEKLAVAHDKQYPKTHLLTELDEVRDITINIFDAGIQREPLLDTFQVDAGEFNHLEPLKGVKISSNPMYAKDFRLVMNLASEQFHNKKLQIIPDILRRDIIFQHGTIYTYEPIERNVVLMYPFALKSDLAAKMRKNKNKLFESFRNGGKMYTIATKIAVDIEYVKSNENLVIEYRHRDINKGLLLGANETLALTPDSYYEIYINNNCSSMEESEIMPSKIKESSLRHSDFQYYYTLLKNVTTTERLDLTPQTGTGSSKFPCDPTYLDW